MKRYINAAHQDNPYDISDATFVKMEKSPAYQELSAECISHGYTLHNAYVSMHGDIRIDVVPYAHGAPKLHLYGKSSGFRAPKVHDVGVRFELQDASRRYMDVEDYARHCQVLERALQLGDWMESWSGWSNLYTLSEEDTETYRQ